MRITAASTALPELPTPAPTRASAQQERRIGAGCRLRIDDQIQVA